MKTPAVVHPHLPRFAQAITGVLAGTAVGLRNPWVALAALVLVLLALVIPRWSPVTLLFRAVASPASSLEPVAPVRFAQILAATFLTLGLVLVGVGAHLVGWVVIGLVAAMALFSAITGICVGCEIYRLALRRRSVDGDVRGLIGLTGTGPWMVVLTAPGCARCGPVTREVETVAAGGAVVRVDLSRTPSAARLPVSSVPAILAVDSEGRVASTATGHLDRDEIAGFVRRFASEVAVSA